jgi:hypothetical protein
MQRVRLQRLIEAYGADPARWPTAERETAKRLLAESPELAAANEARRLDRLLDGYIPVTRTGGAARLESALTGLPPQRAATAPASGPSFLTGVFPRAAVLAAASIAGIFIGLSDIEGSASALARVDVITLISEPELTSLVE